MLDQNGLANKWLILAAVVPVTAFTVYALTGGSRADGARQPSTFVSDARADAGGRGSSKTVSEALEKDTLAGEPEQLSPDELMAQSGPQVDLVDELAREPKLAALAKNADVRALLRHDRRDVLGWMAKASHREKKRVQRAANLIVDKLSSCLADATACGVNQAGWELYFSVGGSPLHQVLERGLEVDKALIEIGDLNPRTVDRAALMQAQKVPHHNISVMATDLLLSSVETEADFAAVLQSSESLQGEARSFFYEVAGPMVRQRGWHASQRAVVESIFSTLDRPLDQGTGTGAWTIQKVVANLDQMGLTQEQFEAVARRACPARPHDSGEDVSGRRVESLQSQARRQGFTTDIVSLCFGSVDSADAG